MRTLEDIKNHINLNNLQKIGIKYYYDLQERINREEVTEI